MKQFDASDESNEIALPNGYEIDDYEIIDVLGSGGFGITYLAKDNRLETKVALKEYLPFDFAVRGSGSRVVARTRADTANFKWGLDRFLDEARTLARLDHPSVVRILRHFDALGTGFIAMEYVQGQTLEASIRDGVWDEARLWPVLDSLMGACSAIHAAGLLHRDIKPANIILKPDGRPTLIDFGAARQATSTRSRSLTAIVSPGFGPPEQYSATATQGSYSDIYALAATCYYALTGQEPIDAPDRVLNDTLLPLAKSANVEGSPQFLRAIDRGMAVTPQGRPQTIDEWRTGFPSPRFSNLDNGGGGINLSPRHAVIGGIAALAIIIATVIGFRYFAPHADGIAATGKSQPIGSVDFNGGQRISALPPTQIDPGTRDALWSDAATLGDTGFLAASTAGKGIENETAVLYLFTSIDRPPNRWTGPVGSRGSAVAAAPDGFVAVTGGDTAHHGFVAAVQPKGESLAELWHRDLGAGRVFGLAYGADIYAALSPDAGDSTIQMLSRDGTIKGAYSPHIDGSRIILHRVVALADGGVATGWAEPTNGKPALFVARFDREGKELWKSIAPASEGGSHGNALLVESDKILVVGWRRVAVNGADLFQGLTATYDLQGKLVSQQIVRQNGSLLLRAVQPAGGGHLFVSGVAFDDLITSQGGAWWVAEIDTDGRVIDTDVNRAPNRHQIAEALAVDAHRGLFALGFSAAGDRTEVSPTAAIYKILKK